MSWINRPKGSPGGQNGTSQTPYNPSQPPQAQSQMMPPPQNMYHEFSGTNTTDRNIPSHDQYWQQQQSFNQQYNQNQYQQQNYTPNNMNTFYNTHLNQSYPAQEQSYQPTYDDQSNQVHTEPSQIANNSQHNANSQPKQNWNETWDWGWDEASKQQIPPPQFQNDPIAVNKTQSNNLQMNNANLLQESFSNSDSWNWSLEEKKDTLRPMSFQQNPSNSVNEAIKPTNNQPFLPTNHLIPQNISNFNDNKINDIIPPPLDENVATLSDKEVVKEHLPNLAIGKRLNLENLTPQWSMESQMSQESSDGPQTQSESTYRSENQSRNSYSPALGSENTNFNNFHAVVEDNLIPNDESCINPVRMPSDSSKIHQLTSSFDQVNIGENSNLLQGMKRPVASYSPKHISPTSQAQSDVSIPKAVPHLPPPLPPLAHQSTNAFSGNPFKRVGPQAHSANNMPHSSSFFNPPLVTSTTLTAPSVVSKATTQPTVSPSYQSANLETTPENSERPDAPQMMGFRQPQIPPPDNLEIAPTNDRNQYLQSSLDSGDYDSSNYSHQTPPPGLQRMVVGQQESEISQNTNIQRDEPPPGLSRMVPGQLTDSLDMYPQSDDNYRDRHIDGQNTESVTNRRPSYRQVEGQPTIEQNYPPTSRATDRRPIGFDRMVMGEPSSGDYSRNQQFSSTSYINSVDQRVVTGLDHDFIPSNNECGNSETREQNLDGSDYSEPTAPQPSRSIRLYPDNHGVSIPFENQNQNTIPEPDEQREVVMEGENLQDLSLISSGDLSVRDQRTDGAGTAASEKESKRKTDMSDSTDVQGQSSRRQSLSKASGEESERDRAFRASPRREREKKRSKERSLRDRDGRKYDRESDRKVNKDTVDRKKEDERYGRRSDRDKREREDRDDRYRRTDRSRRYETEDTDYYSDREKRRYREGSYTSSSKPPRPDERDKRSKDEKDRRRGYSTIERERRYGLDSERNRDGYRKEDRKEGRYDDRDRKYGRDYTRERDHRRYRSPDRRPNSRDPDPVDDELNDSVASRRDRRDRRRPRDYAYDPYYDRYGTAYQDPYFVQLQQHQTYQYYEHLRRTNPVAYMEVYQKVMAGEPLPPPPASALNASGFEPIRTASGLETGYPSLSGFDRPARGGVEERGSVHSGRSSANGLATKDTLAGDRLLRYARGAVAGSSYYCPRRADSIATDLSGSRDFNTDASLNLHLDESTVRSERNTPTKFATAHIKGNISTTNIVMIHPTYPIDGAPATIEILSLNAILENDPVRCELQAFPGPLVKDTTHKKSVIDFCENKIRAALDRNQTRSGSVSFTNSPSIGSDLAGYVLLWEFLILMLRQNGLVVGTDISELLIKNIKEFELRTPNSRPPLQTSSRRNSVVSSNTSRSDLLPDDEGPSPVAERTVTETNIQPDDESWNDSTKKTIDEKVAIEKFRELLLVGNRKDALDWAIKCGLWGHAMQLAATLERRARLAVAARFLQSLPHRDPLHTLYCCAAARVPPVATSVADEKWGDWRPHLAMLLSNPSRPEFDKKTIITLGDTLASRGMIYSSQVCYLCSGVQFEKHPCAPWVTGVDYTPRLALLGSNPAATKLSSLATNEALHATEIYEYARSLNQPDYVIGDFQVYKFLMCTRLVDCGLYERALSYTECLANTLASAPQSYPRQLIKAVAELAERLKYFDPALNEEATLLDDELTELDSNQTSPRHQLWLTNIKDIIHNIENISPQQPLSDVYQQPQPAQPYLQTPESWQETQAMEQQQYNNQAEPHRSEAVPEPTPFDYTSQTFYQEENQPPPPTMYSTYNAGDNNYYYQQQQEEQIDGPQNSHQFTDNKPWGQDANQPNYGYNEPSTGDHRKASEGSNGTYDGGMGMPQISMPNSTAKKSSIFDEPEDESSRGQSENHKNARPNGKSDKSDGNASKQQSAGWFGGIFNKLSLKPKNQMILPDDKNPSIVWDEEKKRWKNLDADGNENDAGAPPPPPKMADIAATAMANIPSPGLIPNAAAPPSGQPTSNIFKMQKSRQIKKAYVDVFNPSGAPIKPLPPAAEVLGPQQAPSAAPSNYFVPPTDGQGPTLYDPAQY